jgi:STAS domain
MDERHPKGEAMVIEMNGTFDVPAAERIALALAEAGEREVSVDLSRVRDFHDHGVAMLARALTGHRRVQVRGLSHHQLRLLRYLGVETVVPDDPMA